MLAGVPSPQIPLTSALALFMSTKAVGENLGQDAVGIRRRARIGRLACAGLSNASGGREQRELGNRNNKSTFTQPG